MTSVCEQQYYRENRCV